MVGLEREKPEPEPKLNVDIVVVELLEFEDDPVKVGNVRPEVAPRGFVGSLDKPNKGAAEADT